MSRKKSRNNLLFAIIAVMSIGVIAVWQFYMFVTFKNTNGMVDVQGGIQHLWWAIGFGLLGFTAAVLFFLRTKSAMSSMYGMQRANGDWFALEEKLSFRVPLFSSHSEAMRVRAC